jgi:hypothetical protein
MSGTKLLTDFMKNYVHPVLTTIKEEILEDIELKMLNSMSFLTLLDQN